MAWTLPAEYGVLTSAENLQEQGTNLMFTAYGEKRFRVVNVIPAALPAEDFGDVFPSVDELVERYIEKMRKENCTSELKSRSYLHWMVSLMMMIGWIFWKCGHGRLSRCLVCLGMKSCLTPKSSRF